MSNWSGIAALGEMAKGAGKYYGTLSSEQRKAERLAQARAGQIADRDEAREYNEARTAENREYAEGQNAEARLYKEEQDRLSRKRALLEKEEDNATWEERQAIQTEDKMALEESKGGGSGGYKLTESQSKQLQHYTNGMRGFQNAEKALDAGFGAEGFEGLVSAASDGSYLANWVGSAEGQMYHQGLREATEAILRIRTGAAAQEKEVDRLMKTFEVRAGDKPEQVAQKRQTFERAVNQMQMGLPSQAIDESKQFWEPKAEPQAAPPADADVDAFLSNL